MKEDEAVEQLHQEKRELQIKLDKLEKVLHKINTETRQVFIYFPKNVQVAYNMFYNMIDYGITDW